MQNHLCYGVLKQGKIEAKIEELTRSILKGYQVQIMMEEIVALNEVSSPTVKCPVTVILASPMQQIQKTLNMSFDIADFDIFSDASQAFEKRMEKMIMRMKTCGLN